MQYEIFTIPVSDNENQVEQMNRFLRGHKVVQVERKFFITGGNAYWSFCVNYLITSSFAPATGDKHGKVDYKNVLDEEHFKIFTRLRAFRKRIAENDAVPAYAVFTDAELAQLSLAETFDEKTMLGIEGIGKKRLEKYGMTLLKMLKENSETENNIVAE